MEAFFVPEFCSIDIIRAECIVVQRSLSDAMDKLSLLFEQIGHNR